VMERTVLVLLHSMRGEPELAEQALHLESLEGSDDFQAMQTLDLHRATMAFHAGAFEDAVRFGRATVGAREQVGLTQQAEAAYAVMGSALIDLGDADRGEALLAEMQEAAAGHPSPYLAAEIAWLTARLAALRGDAPTAGAEFEQAIAGFRAIGMRPFVATSLASYGQWLESVGRTEQAQPVLDEARSIFEELKAIWWLERLDRAAAAKRSALA
jgi:hypothetical protein